MAEEASAGVNAGDKTIKVQKDSLAASQSEAKADLELLGSILGIEARTGKHRCPFHDDIGPSLSIRQKDGVYRWKCFAGCGGGTVIDALAKRDSIPTEEACIRLGGNPNAIPRRYRRIAHCELKSGVEQPPPIPRALRLDSAMNAIREQVAALPKDMLVALRQRGILSTICERFNVSFFLSIKFGEKNDYFASWLIPVPDETGNFKAIKIHREVPRSDESKSAWLPVGMFADGQPQHRFNTLWPSPEIYDADSLPDFIIDWPLDLQDRFEALREEWRSYYIGILNDCDFVADEQAERIVREEQKRTNPRKDAGWLILNPGELKALACVSAGLHSTAITAGESHKWTRSLVERLSGRRVAILYDDDTAGVDFRDRTISVLQRRCIELKAITFGKGSNRKKIDANDIAARQGTTALRHRILGLLDAAPDLAKKSFNLTEHRSELVGALRNAMSSNASSVHLFRSVVGAGKSRALMDAINEAGTARFAIFVHSHRLAREYEEKITGALRLLSPEQMNKEELGPDGGRCKHAARIAASRAKGLPYSRLICEKCPFSSACVANQQKFKCEETRVLILQHAHLRLLESRPELTRDRTLIIDESCIGNGLRWVREFNDEYLNDFAAMLELFFQTESGEKQRDGVIAMRGVISRLRALGPGQSASFSQVEQRPFARGLSSAWTEWLAASDARGMNLMPLLLGIVLRRRWIRCGEKKDQRIYWLVQESQPDERQQIIVLDATGKTETYRAMFPDRTITVWPESEPPAPASDVIQFVEGAYPAMSLWDGATPKPAFLTICEHVRQTVKAKALDWSEVGIVTLKKLIPATRTAFPEIDASRILHYGHLRGINTLKDCELVALIGCQPPSDWDVAKTAVALFDLDVDIKALVEAAGRHRRFEPLAGEHGIEHEVEVSAFSDLRFELAWDLMVQSEIVQALGRARPYESRDKRQSVLVFTHLPLSCPVSRTMTRQEHLRELGMIGEASKDIGQRAVAAMTVLAAGPFGYSELAAKMRIAESTLTQKPEYRTAVQAAAKAIGLEFRRGGNGERGRFQKQTSPSLL